MLVLADGAAWIWNLVENRFQRATQRVDLYHVKEHLWTVRRHGMDLPPRPSALQTRRTILVAAWRRVAPGLGNAASQRALAFALGPRQTRWLSRARNQAELNPKK